MFNDIAVGGGFTIVLKSAGPPTPNFQVLENLPLDGLPGWEVELVNKDPETPADTFNNVLGLFAHVVCFDRPPLR